MLAGFGGESEDAEEAPPTEPQEPEDPGEVLLDPDNPDAFFGCWLHNAENELKEPTN